MIDMRIVMKDNLEKSFLANRDYGQGILAQLICDIGHESEQPFVGVFGGMMG